MKVAFKSVGATSFLSVAGTALYFQRFPIILNSLFSDAVAVLLITISFACLIALAVIARGKSETVLTLLAIMMVAFVVRAIPQLRFANPPFHDPYFYAIGVLNIQQYGTLDPRLLQWYPQTPIILSWPAMHLLTFDLSAASGAPPSLFFRFQEPFVGSLTALALFLASRTVTARTNVSLLAALILTSSDVVIFYQAEYHPQGLAVFFLVLFLYAYFRSTTGLRFTFTVVALLFGMSLVLVHHFSSIFVALLAVGFVVTSIVLEKLGHASRGPKELSTKPESRSVWILLAATAIAYFILVQFSPLAQFINALQETRPPSLIVRYGSGVPVSTTVLNAMKWAILLFAAVGVVLTVRGRQRRLWVLLAVFAVLLSAVGVGDFLIGGPTDRFIAFMIPVASIFAAMGWFWLTAIKPSRRKFTKAAPAALAALLLVVTVGGVINSQIPTVYFHSAQPNPYYWSSDVMTSLDYYGPTGGWLASYTPANSTYTTQFDTVVVPFFFAQRSFDSVTILQPDNVRAGPAPDVTAALSRGGYAVLNPSVPYYYGRVPFDATEWLAANNVLYTNGVVVISVEGSTGTQ